MSSFLLRPSKALLPLVMLLGIAAHAGAAESEAPDTGELYQYLFPEAQGAAVAPASVPTEPQALPQAPRAVSGFRSLEKRVIWSSDQVSAMRDAFKRKDPAPAQANAIPMPAESGLFDPQAVGLGDEPYAVLIQKYAAENNVSAHLISQMIHAESRNDPNAISSKGAQGLMQLMPDLSKQFKIDPFDPEMNIKVGTQYFAGLLSKYKRTDYALAAYNAGPGNVDKYDGIPPFEETQNYVSSIMAGVAQLEARN